MELCERNWKEFFIAGDKGVFYISATASGIDKNKLNMESGKVPYITRSNEMNGMNLFITDEQHSKWKMDSGNVITIGLDTQTVFYQPHKFFTGQNIQVLKHEQINRDVAMFIISMLNVQMKKFNWGGNGATLSRLCRTKMMLPVNESEEPDFGFMEQYIKEIEKEKTQKYFVYCKQRIAELGDIVPLKSFSEIKWKPYRIDKIADVDSGRDIYDAERIDGDTPYITASATNNGIKYYVDNTNATLEANAISVNRNGSVGYSFYHKYKALYSNDCRKLKVKENNSEYVALFITNQIMQQRTKYSYGYKMGTGRLRRQYIQLPVNDLGKPDYEYMEQYIKNIMIKKYKSYITYTEKVL